MRQFITCSICAGKIMRIAVSVLQRTSTLMDVAKDRMTFWRPVKDAEAIVFGRQVH